MEEKMKCGTIDCSCGQAFYFETIDYQVSCIKCDKVHDVSMVPIYVEQVEVEPETEVQNGTDI